MDLLNVPLLSRQNATGAAAPTAVSACAPHLQHLFGSQLCPLAALCYTSTFSLQHCCCLHLGCHDLLLHAAPHSPPGEAIKALINEEFGDGIMSAIGFYATVDKMTGNEGEARVVITFNGEQAARQRLQC